jgi:hypothetical protein
MTTIKTTLEPELLVSDAHGIYVIQSFCKAYQSYITNMDEVKEDFAICLEGPEHPEYLEAWQMLEQNVKLTNDKAESFTIGYLGESGDLWAIPEGYEYPED